MKKILLLAVMAVSLSLGACSKDDDSKPSLKNTQWVDVENSTEKKFDFFTDSDCRYIIHSAELNKTNTDVYSYTYEANTVIMTPGTSGLATLKGTIAGNKMEVTNTSSNQSLGVFTKK